MLDLAFPTVTVSVPDSPYANLLDENLVHADPTPDGVIVIINAYDDDAIDSVSLVVKRPDGPENGQGCSHRDGHSSVGF